MLLRRFMQLLHAVISLVWLVMFLLVSIQASLFGLGMIIALPALPIMFAFAMAAPDASAGGFFLMLLVFIFVFLLCLVKLGLFGLRYGLYIKRLRNKFSTSAPVYIGIAQILLSVVLLAILKLIYKDAADFLPVEIDKGFIMTYLIIESIPLLIDTRLYGHKLPSAVTVPLARFWSFIGYLVPGIYVLGLKGAGWRKIIALIQIPLFLFSIQGFFLGYYPLATIFTALILLWNYYLRRSAARRVEQLKTESATPAGVVL